MNMSLFNVSGASSVGKNEHHAGSLSALLGKRELQSLRQKSDLSPDQYSGQKLYLLKAALAFERTYEK